MNTPLKRTNCLLVALTWLLLPSIAAAELSKVPWKAVQQLEEEGNTVQYDKNGFVSKIMLSDFPEDFTMGQLAIFPQLESLEVQSRYYFQDDKMIGISKLANLKNFTVRSCRYASNGVIELLAEAPAIERLEIERCNQINNLLGLTRLRHLKHLKIIPEDTLSFRPLIECRGLETLEIRDCSTVDDLVLKDICRATSLKSLSLNQVNISDEGLKEIGKLPALEKLSFSGCEEITGIGFGDFQFPQTLKDLNLEFMRKLNDEGLAEITRFTNLEHLRLNGNEKVSGSGFTCLESLQKLKTLNCPNTNIGDEHLKLLGGIESLETISLQHCQDISGRGLAALSASTNCKNMTLSHCRNIDSPDFEVIARFKKLEKLNLANTRLRPAGMEQLCELKQLKSLNIEGNVWLDDTAFAKLQQSTVSNLTATRLPRLTDCCLEHAAKMPNLKSLKISANRNLDGSGLKSFLGHRTLKSLHLQKPKHLSLKAFSLIKQISSIENLKFDDGNLTIAQVEQLAGMSNLETFNYTLEHPDHNSERLLSVLRSLPNL